MKNFDHPYTNDSPVDLSGREGYDPSDDLRDRITELEKALRELTSASVEYVIDNYKVKKPDRSRMLQAMSAARSLLK